MVAMDAPSSWLSGKPINVWVVGAGGNGGEVVDALAQFHTALLALGGAGLVVTIIDDATVREVNLVRQRFWAPEIGQYKSITLANRYNMMLGCEWQGWPMRVKDAVELAKEQKESPDLVISAVDLPSVRCFIHEAAWGRMQAPIWLDLGNNARNGQAIIGRAGDTRYPTVVDHYPEIRDMPDDTTKSCSTAEAIAAQDCLVNRAVSTAGMTLVWDLLRRGKTEKNGLIVDLESGHQVPLPFPELAAGAA